MIHIDKFQHIFLLCILLSISFAGSSQIEGYISNSDSEEPLIGANIMLDEILLGSASDENGKYLITNIPIGKYTLRAMFIGYENLEKDIWIKGEQIYTIDITLKPSALELQETKVTAEKRKGKVAFLANTFKLEALEMKS